MSYPTQTFNTFAELRTYINNLWVTNGDGDITGEIGNNVVNGLLTFITQSPLNYQEALIYTAGGSITEPQPVTIFTTSTPTSLQWPDDIYNQYVFVNATDSAIPITGGLRYYDINLVAKTSIPARTIVSLMKATNGYWVNIYNAGGSSGGGVVSSIPLIFKVGESGSPMSAGDTGLVITVNNAIEDSEFIFLDGNKLTSGQDDRISYTAIYTSTTITINFNQAVSNGQLYDIKYQTQTP